MLRKIRLSAFNLMSPIIISLLVVLLWVFHIYLERQHFKEQSALFETAYLNIQKQRLNYMVTNSIDFIRYKQSQVEERVKHELNIYVQEAYSIAETLYRDNRGTLSESQIRRLILLSLDSFHFHRGRGYFFVYSLDGTELLSSEKHTISPATGTYTPEDKRGITNELIRIAVQQKQGLFEYSWPKPGAAGQRDPRIAYVKYFEPYDWVIGSGEYVDDTKTEIRGEIVEWFEQLRLSETAYVWINDTELGMVAHPFYSREAKPAWYQAGGLANLTDPDGRRMFVEMRDLCLERGSAYLTFQGNAPDQARIFARLGYGELVKDLGWIVAAGINLDEMEKAIQLNKAALDDQTRREIIRLSILVMAIILLTAGITRYFHRKVEKAFQLFSVHFQRAAGSRTNMDPSGLDFLEFRELAGYVNDMIDDRRKADDKLKASEEQLLQAQKMEAVGRLAGGIAHDFSNLLMAVIGYAEMALWKPDLDRDIRSGLQEIQQAAEKASTLTHQLLAFSRKQILEPVVINLNSLIVNLEKMLHRVIGEDIRLITELDSELQLIEADHVQIEQVILNLVVNARDAMPDGGKLRICTKNAILDERFCESNTELEAGAYVLVEIADTGIGMDEDTKEHAFEPFFTTKEAGKGTGLGLSTVYGIVRQSGGQIGIESAPGQGTVFGIYFPPVKEETGKSEAAEEATALTGGEETLLVVEDEKIVRKMIASTLRSVGYQVIEAENGKKALEVLTRGRTARIDLILTDVIMPDISGEQLALRLSARYKDTPILFMSGYPGSKQLGSRPYIQKPFSPYRLCSRIRELLDSPQNRLSTGNG